MATDTTDGRTDPTITVEHPIPRTLDAYDPTEHFLERLKYRTDPDPTERIVRETLEHGVIKHTQQADRFIFEDERGLYTWRVIARVDEVAFRTTDRSHELLTIYALDRHEDTHRTVFDDGGA